EFDVRPFLLRYPRYTLRTLAEWADDPNEHVRRLVSESTRTRLPWSVHLEAFKRNPKPVLQLLERLKDDESRYVQRSVANSLGDILKDNPDVGFSTLERWALSGSAGRRWLIRHAVRYQAGKGVPRALRLFGI